MPRRPNGFYNSLKNSAVVGTAGLALFGATTFGSPQNAEAFVPTAAVTSSHVPNEPQEPPPIPVEEKKTEVAAPTAKEAPSEMETGLAGVGLAADIATPPIIGGVTAGAGAIGRLGKDLWEGKPLGESLGRFGASLPGIAAGTLGGGAAADATNLVVGEILGAAGVSEDMHPPSNLGTLGAAGKAAAETPPTPSGEEGEGPSRPLRTNIAGYGGEEPSPHP